MYEYVELTLLEDVYSPSPPRNDVIIKTSREYEAWREKYPTEQFCFTNFGKKVSDFFKNNAKVDFFSLDCGLTTDGTDWFCES